jgi:hypothetical protein
MSKGQLVLRCRQLGIKPWGRTKNLLSILGNVAGQLPLIFLGDHKRKLAKFEMQEKFPTLSNLCVQFIDNSIYRISLISSELGNVRYL